MYLELQEVAKQKQQLEELNRKMKQRAEKFGSAYRQLTLEDFRAIKLQKAKDTGDASYLKDLAILQEISDPTEREKLIYERAKKFFTTIEVKDAQSKLCYKQEFFEVRNVPDFTDQNIQFRENALHLYGVDYMSNDYIRNYFGLNYPVKIEWLNDSSCNIVLPTKEMAGALVEQFTRKDLQKQQSMKDETQEMWYEFRPYTVEGTERRLYARVATNKDLKSNTVSGKNSKYYQYVMSKLRLKKFVQTKARQTLIKTKKIHKLTTKREHRKEEQSSSSSDAQSSSDQQPAQPMKAEPTEQPSDNQQQQ